MNKILISGFTILLLIPFTSLAHASESTRDFIVTDNNGGKLLRVTPEGVVTTIASGLGSPYGVVIDSDGNFIVTDFDSGELHKVTGSGAVTTIVRDIGHPVGLAIDSDGNFIVTELDGGIFGNQTGKLLRVTPEGVVTTIASGHNIILDFFTINSDGNFIATYYGESKLFLIPSNCANVCTPTTIATCCGAPYAAVVDSGGNFIVVDNVGKLLRVTPEGVVTTIASGLGSPMDITTDSDGNFIVTDNGETIATGGNLFKVTACGVVTKIASNGIGTPAGVISMAKPVLGKTCSTISGVPVDKNSVTTHLTNTTLLPTSTNATAIPSTYSKVPNWVKGIFNYYAQGDLSRDDLLKTLQFLIQQGIIKVT